MRAATRRQQTDESHEAFIRRAFPQLADQLGYSADYIGGFLMGSGGAAPGVTTVAAGAEAWATDAEHAALMARHFPAVTPGHPQRRATIRTYS